jgi:hypothetical protein
LRGDVAGISALKSPYWRGNSKNQVSEQKIGFTEMGFQSRNPKARASRNLGGTVIDLAQIVRGEYHENAIRENFRPTEAHAIYESVGPIEVAAAKARMAAGGGDKRVRKISLPATGQTRDKVGKFCGVSGRTQDRLPSILIHWISKGGKFGVSAGFVCARARARSRQWRCGLPDTRTQQRPPPGVPTARARQRRDRFASAYR